MIYGGVQLQPVQEAKAPSRLRGRECKWSWSFEAAPRNFIVWKNVEPCGIRRDFE